MAWLGLHATQIQEARGSEEEEEQVKQWKRGRRAPVSDDNVGNDEVWQEKSEC